MSKRVAYSTSSVNFEIMHVLDLKAILSKEFVYVAENDKFSAKERILFSQRCLVIN